MKQDKKYPGLKGTIFIVTYGRSGSTLLQSLLQTIPGAHITGENFNTLFMLFEAAKRARRTKRIWGKKQQPKDHPWHGADAIKSGRFDQRLANVFIEEVLRPPIGARWIGFKEIRYQQCGDALGPFLEYLHRVFPNAFFVFNSRCSADVAKSKWWVRQSEKDVHRMVKMMDAEFSDYATRHPEYAHHVRFEDLVADLASVQPLFDKLGETLDLSRAGIVLDKRLTH